MQRKTKAFETLESRMMMSAAPLFDTAVATDRLQIRLDLLKLNVDVFSDAATIAADNRTLKADHVYANKTLAPLVEKFHNDVYSFDLTLKADRLNEASAVLADEAVVVEQLKKMFSDRKDPTALATDRTVLITDRANLQGAMVAGLTQRINDREAGITQIQSDASAILTALPTSGASTQLTADVTTWLDDKAAAMAKITADLTKLSVDRTQLITDLNAENT